MHALIVLAHPEPGSYTAALARTAAAALEAAGWSVDLDDLVREGFTGGLTRADFAPAPDAELVQLMWAQEEATERDGYAPAVLDQMRRLQAERVELLENPGPARAERRGERTKPVLSRQ